jgi:hypothetical protein
MVASLGAFDMLEPYTVKFVRAVLKGLGGSDAARLPGFYGVLLSSAESDWRVTMPIGPSSSNIMF